MLCYAVKAGISLPRQYSLRDELVEAEAEIADLGILQPPREVVHAILAVEEFA